MKLRRPSGAVDAGASDAGPDAADARAACDPTALCATGELHALAPRVLLLVDRSGSMTYEFTPGITRWQALSQVLTEPDVGVIAHFQNEVEFALAFYTYRGPASARCEVLSSLFLANYGQAFIDHPPILHGQTPTAEALQQAGESLLAPFSTAQPAVDSHDAGPAPGDGGAAHAPGAIILATDGMPDSCVDQKVDTEGTADAQHAVAAQVVDRVSSLYRQGIRTYVVGVGSELQRAHLQELANAGVGYDALTGTGQPGAVYQAGDSAALRAAFDDHVSTLRSCSFPLDRAVTDVSLAQVSLDDRTLEWGKDWVLDGQARVSLIGAACEQLKQGGGHVRATIPCGCD